MFRTHMGMRTSFGTQNCVLRSQTEVTIHLQSGTMCNCHHPVHPVNTHLLIPLLRPTAASTILAERPLHFETGAMGSSPPLAGRGKFHLQCHRICQLHMDDTAFWWGQAYRLGLALLVPGFLVPERYLSLCFRDLRVAAIR